MPILLEEGRPERGHGAQNEITKCQSRLRSAHGDLGVHIIVGVHHGAYEAANEGVINESSGYCRNTIYHAGRAIFTSIFILWKHNCNLHCSALFSQCTMNTGGHKP